MKRYLFCLVVLMGMTIVGVCQSPQKFNYQAVVWNEHNELVVEQDLKVEVSLLQGSEMGVAVYSETYDVHTNKNGLISINVGSLGTLANVDWSDGPYFLKVEPSEGYDNWFIATTRQLVSVPYALHAKVVDSVRNVNTYERQVLNRVGDTIYLTGGSYVVLPRLFDGDYNKLTNKPINISEFENDRGYMTGEVQALSMSNDTIYLSDGNFVKLPVGFDDDYNKLTNRPTIPTAISSLSNDEGYITQERQRLSITGDDIHLTGGSQVHIPFVTEEQTLADVVVIGNEVENRQLKNLGDPTEEQDVVTKRYLDSQLKAADVDYGLGTYHVHTVDACEEYVWHGMRYTTSGEYTYVYENAGTYYSVDTLKLTIRQGTYNSESVRVTGKYRWNDEVYTESGVMVHNYYNKYGCSSADTLKLTILPMVPTCKSYRMQTDTATVVACGGTTWYGAMLDESGVYEHSLGNIAYNGCDSVVKVNVEIKDVYQHDTMARTETSITWRGESYSIQGDYGDTLTARNGCDSIYMLHLQVGGKEGIGATKGVFTVGNGVKVRFSQGNLQYQASTKYWRFAENQYDVLLTPCPSEDYSDWTDLYGWATSGYHNANDAYCVNYQPWSNSITAAISGTDEALYNQYGYGPSVNNAEKNIVGDNANYDWGVYNSIINGGNGIGLWRTMSESEWNYVMNERRNARYLRSKGCIEGLESNSGATVTACGYFLMPDNWTRPSGVGFIPNTDSIESNRYSVSEWEILEASGAVFLPAGYIEEGAYCGYWTSTNGGTGGAKALVMSEDEMIMDSYNRSNSYSVRLVQNYSEGIEGCECTYLDTTIIANGTFSWHGYTYTASGNYMETMVNAAGCDSIISLHLIMQDAGALAGQFSVSPTKKVSFSKGNLQYKPSDGLWRFAEEQYDYVGDANKFRSKNYSGWIDIFGWATSGYHDSTDLWNKYYKPWEMEWSEYGYGPSVQMRDLSLVNTSEQYDWGKHNAISNGGNVVGEWRTLTYEEWKYLMYKRPSASKLVGNAKVNNVRGLLILPDGWVRPSGIYFNPHSSRRNVYNEAKWQKLEASGAVFLPLAGISRGSNTVDDIGKYGQYWTSSSLEKLPNMGKVESAYCVMIDVYWNSHGYCSKSYGCSVRLVKDM